MKTITKLCMILFSLVLMILPVQAESAQYVIDQENLLTEEEIHELNQTAQEITEQYGVGVYIRFYADYDADSIQAYGEKIYKEENLGNGAENEGILLLVTMADRSYDITAFGEKANTVFTDYRKHQLAEDFLPDLSDGACYDAAQSFLNDVSDYLYQAEYGDPSDNNAAQSMSTGTKAALIITVPSVIALIICIALAHMNKTSRIARNADAYITKDGFKITGMQDVFLYQTRTVTHVPKDRDSTSASSAGRSHSSGHF